ncbi:hypothetical protein ASPWEDRAFT_442668 [Aspergillus wentii DTO 134E9]|uniref:Uncharacterized protein n=1 Tax=Aspergillus wentii DTO 134E9 TaxID=1073089 RepID=A0A1L9RQS3_ASPWE|nr:uncharacterized protein ASPWEDRAFT_442668 [Aspergillus wentii DTO 134E9]OJJ37178.1 hypothetical protein ASPWEDRAFT_442668 [Aspergillus wentii DTO 134E9]
MNEAAGAVGWKKMGVEVNEMNDAYEDIKLIYTVMECTYWGDIMFILMLPRSTLYQLYTLKSSSWVVSNYTNQQNSNLHNSIATHRTTIYSTTAMFPPSFLPWLFPWPNTTTTPSPSSTSPSILNRQKRRQPMRNLKVEKRKYRALRSRVLSRNSSTPRSALARALQIYDPGLTFYHPPSLE